VLDVRPLYYVSPLTEQEIGPITPVIRLRNLADEDATVTGLFRIYRDSTGLLEYSSDLAVTPLAHGTSADIPALTPFSPGAVADDDYFVICELEYRSIQTGNVTRGNLGPFYFDTKAPPMGPVPAGHHPTHENAGMDEIDLAGMSGLLADPQTPETHAGTHEDGQADEVNVAGLHGELADDQPALAHDIAGARHTSTATPAQLLQADANGLPVDATNTDADVAAAVGASHARQHAITDTDDHTSTATPAQLLQADANGLPVDATNTDADVAAAVGASHARQHAITDTDDHTSTATPAQLLQADANGLPVDASNTDAEVTNVVLQTKPQTLTDQANIDWDLALGGAAQVTLGGNRTLNAPTSMVNGARYRLKVIQDGTGTRLITWNAVYRFPGGVDPCLTAAINCIDILVFDCDGTHMDCVGMVNALA